MEQLELAIKMKEEAWSAIQEGWKSKEEAWKMMEAMWKSNNSKTETQAVLPPLVIDRLVQTDRLPRKNEFCQTVQSDGVDFQIQVSMQPERKIVSTQTIKEEHVEIALPNRPSSSSPKKTKKRKLSSIQTARCNEQHPDEETPSSSCSGFKNDEKLNGAVTQKNSQINGDHSTTNGTSDPSESNGSSLDDENGVFQGPKIEENGNIVMHDGEQEIKGDSQVLENQVSGDDDDHLHNFQPLDLVWAKCSGTSHHTCEGFRLNIRLL